MNKPVTQPATRGAGNGAKLAVAISVLVIAGVLITWQLWPTEIASGGVSPSATTDSGADPGTPAGSPEAPPPAPRPPEPGDAPRGNYRSGP